MDHGEHDHSPLTRQPGQQFRYRQSARKNWRKRPFLHRPPSPLCAQLPDYSRASTGIPQTTQLPCARIARESRQNPKNFPEGANAARTRKKRPNFPCAAARAAMNRNTRPLGAARSPTRVALRQHFSSGSPAFPARPRIVTWGGLATFPKTASRAPPSPPTRPTPACTEVHALPSPPPPKKAGVGPTPPRVQPALASRQGGQGPPERLKMEPRPVIC